MEIKPESVWKPVLYLICICSIILMFDYFINLRKKVYELWVIHFINCQEKLFLGPIRQWSTARQILIARSVNPCEKMELAIWKLCRYRIFSLLVVGNMIAYMNRLAINFALLSMSPKNKVNKNGTCFNNSVLVQTHYEAGILN